MKSTRTSVRTIEEAVAGLLPPVPTFSLEVQTTFALYLLSQAELAGLTIEPPIERPLVRDAATEAAARLYDLDQHGLLDRLSPYQLTRVLRRQYNDRQPDRALNDAGFAMLLEADRADAIRATVTAEPLPGDLVTATREVRLHQRIEELDATYDSLWETRRRARLRYLLIEEARVAEPVWASR